MTRLMKKQERFTGSSAKRNGSRRERTRGVDNSEPFSDADWNGETRRPEEMRYQLVVDESKNIWTGPD